MRHRCRGLPNHNGDIPAQGLAFLFCFIFVFCLLFFNSLLHYTETVPSHSTVSSEGLYRTTRRLYRPTAQYPQKALDCTALHGDCTVPQHSILRRH